MIHLNNPINPGWYADPEARFYEGEYWIYATRSRRYREQLNQTACQMWGKSSVAMMDSAFSQVLPSLE